MKMAKKLMLVSMALALVALAAPAFAAAAEFKEGGKPVESGEFEVAGRLTFTEQVWCDVDARYDHVIHGRRNRLAVRRMRVP